MKKNAKILKFNVNKLKTLKELQGAQIALLRDIASGAVTVAESRPIYKELNALVKRWHKLMKEPSTPREMKELGSIFGQRIRGG